MSDSRHSEAAFETVIEAHLLQNGYVSIPAKASTATARSSPTPSSLSSTRPSP